MKRITKALIIITMATIIVAIRQFQSPDKAVESALIVGTSADFPPFSYIDASGAIVGFDIDLIEELFKRLGQPYRLEDMPFETLLPQIQFGGIDLIAAGMSPTPERAQRIFFSKPYLEADPLTIVTLAGSPIKSLDDLEKRTVAVNQGYVADMKLSERPGIQLLKLPSATDALLALKHGKAEAFVTGARTVKPLEDILGKERLSTIAIPEMVEATALGISKKRPELVDQINAALAALRNDGSLARLLAKWHID